MERDDVEGAKAAAQYFLSLYPYAYNTGDLTEWKAMSHPECVFCASVIENVEALHAQGGYQTGGEITWLNVEGAGNASTGTASVDAVAEQAPTAQVIGSQVEEISAGGRASVYIDLIWSNDWQIRGVDVEGES